MTRVPVGRRRLPRYVWERFDEEVRRQLDRHGIPGTTRPNWTKAKLAEEMASWCRDTWGQEPADSTIRRRLELLIKRGATALLDQREPATPRKRPGRRVGQGSYARLDEPLVNEMESLIRDGKAASHRAAALKVAGTAHGAGTFDSKVERLARRSRERAKRGGWSTRSSS